MNTHVYPSIPVGVIGANGYTGREVLAVLASHPNVAVQFATSRSEAGRPSPIPGLALRDPDEVPLEDARVLFLCVPHGEARAWVERFRGGAVKIVDLTADHRPGSGADAGVTYGLAEVESEAVSSASVVANPGCYPTGVLLSLLPLRDEGLIDLGRPVIVNAASGVTGAGRTPRTDLLFAEVHGNFRAYGIGNQHRHLLEMRALLPDVQLLFTPHLLPVPRGILETITLPVARGVDAGAVKDAWRSAYGESGAVRTLDQAPSLSDVVSTDRLLLSAHDNVGLAEPLVTVVAALDNLGKGAAGQAVQNMNLMLGLDPLAGIRC